jgi:hypothetical protein
MAIREWAKAAAKGKGETRPSSALSAPRAAAKEATAKAQDADRAKFREGKGTHANVADLHQKAADAHEQAAKSATSMGYSGLARSHTQTAERHREAVEHHRERAGDDDIKRDEHGRFASK